MTPSELLTAIADHCEGGGRLLGTSPLVVAARQLASEPQRTPEMTMTVSPKQAPAPAAEEDTTAPPAAIVRAEVHGDEFRFALEPVGFREAQAVSAIIAKTGICKIRTPEEALVRLMTGRSLGIPTFIALQHVYDVEGRPSLSAKLKVALCLRHPDCIYFDHVESDETHATYRTKRRGREEQKRTFTIEDAKRAGLVKPESNWAKWPRRMLQARASGELADIVFPDAVMGMPSVEEAIDERESAPRVGEMQGEIVTAAEAKKSVDHLYPGPPQAAPPRDLEKEAAALKARIAAAKNDVERKAVRADVATFLETAGEPYAGDVKAYYNETIASAAAKAQAGAASAGGQ